MNPWISADEPWLSRIGLNVYFFIAQILFGEEALFYHVANACLLFSSVGSFLSGALCHQAMAIAALFPVLLAHQRAASR